MSFKTLTPQSAIFEDTLYDDVMSNPRSRHAYYHTTQATLFGRFDDEDLQKVLTHLNQAHVAYLYNHDENRSEPMFMTENKIYVGTAEIKAYINKISAVADA